MYQENEFGQCALKIASKVAREPASGDAPRDIQTPRTYSKQDLYAGP